MQSSRCFSLSCLCVALLSLVQPLHALPAVPGFDVLVYASVTDPIRLDLDTAGNLYAGRDNSGSNGNPNDAVYISRIAAGGVPVSDYGLSMVSDPDAVVVDREGLFSAAGSVLIGGVSSSGYYGRISVVSPEESVSTLYGPTTAFWNPTDFVFDGERLLLTNYDTNPSRADPGVYSWEGPGTNPVLLIETDVPAAGLTLNSQGDIFVSTVDGRVQRYTNDGSLIDAEFVVDAAAVAVSLCAGDLGGTGDALYLVNGQGELICVSDVGNAHVIGSGFENVQDLLIDEAGRLFVSEFDADRILLISRIDEPWIEISYLPETVSLSFGGILQSSLDPDEGWVDVDPQPTAGTHYYLPIVGERRFWRTRCWTGCAP